MDASSSNERNHSPFLFFFLVRTLPLTDIEELERSLSDRDTLMEGLDSEIGKLKAEKEAVSLFAFVSTQDHTSFVGGHAQAFTHMLGWWTASQMLVLKRR